AVYALGVILNPLLMVPSAIYILIRHSDLRLRLFGDASVVEPLLQSLLVHSPAPLRDRVELVHCPDAVAMDEKPAQALRRKRDSSLWHALKAVADGAADACVSAGNTGALMAMGRARVGLRP